MTLVDQIEDFLTRVVEERYAPANPLRPAIAYALLGAGKRVRAQLVLTVADVVGGTRANALVAAAAVEMIHAYSLAHDDLPCLDDDDLRRGKPSLHKQFDEAQALLAGDALQTDSFAILADPEFCAATAGAQLTERQRLLGLRELTHAAGGTGMVEGQMLDVQWTGATGGTVGQLDEIHTKKTGYLIGASCAMGAICAGASDEAVAAMRTFGRHIGLAFQIVDDLLDGTEGTGKSVGKDAAAHKLTYPALIDRQASEQAVRDLTEKALALLSPWEETAVDLRAFAVRLIDRRR